jgi:hypothetical protein
MYRAAICFIHIEALFLFPSYTVVSLLEGDVFPSFILPSELSLERAEKYHGIPQHNA